MLDCQRLFNFSVVDVQLIFAEVRYSDRFDRTSFVSNDQLASHRLERMHRKRTMDLIVSYR
jgi:hypothetical protein